jgi:dihydropteroate synthase
MQNRNKDSFFLRKNSLNIKGNLFDLSVPRIMGILNITPDSFYDGGKYTNTGTILKRVKQMIDEGADIIDIGACSTRPGSTETPVNDEINKLLNAVNEIKKQFPDCILSIDTYRPEVADKMIHEFQVDMINDITAGGQHEEMFDIIAEHKVPYIMMHIKGTPQNMQQQTDYDHIINDILNYFAEKKQRLVQKGVNDIILDPGFGFAKTIDQNYQLLHHLETFRYLELPLMAGISRKSMIYKTLDIKPQEALTGTTALHAIALLNGANLLRVHDVKEARQVVQLLIKYKTASLQ